MSGTEVDNGKLRLDSIEYSSDRKTARLTGAITIVRNTGSGQSTRRIELFFEVPRKYGKYLLTERCDAFIVLFLHGAVSKGYDIESSVPMSSDLYYNITEHLLPILNKNSRHTARIDVPVAEPPEPGFAVGTGMSCGVDSLSTIRMYSGHPDDDLNLTHLCINNVGAFNVIYSAIGVEKAREAAYERSREASKIIGLPLIETNSNANKVFPQNHLYTHSFSSMFAVLCLSKLWKTYHYASSGLDHASSMDLDGWEHNDSSAYELLLFRYLSTRRLMIYSSGEVLTRFEKLRSISDYDVARRHIYSCTSSDRNCGVCDKCIRNLTGLDCLGKLDDFSESYDVERYRNVRRYYLTYVYNRRSEEMFKPVYDAFMESGDEGMKTVAAIDEAVDKFDRLWEENDEESDLAAVRSLKKYRYSSVKAALRMAKAYSSGRGVAASPKLEKRCLKAVERLFLEEIENGIDRSRCNLFDFLWAQGRYDELAPMIEPMKEKGCGTVRYAKMLRYGIGLERDVEQARAIMDRLVRKSPKYLENYRSMFPEERGGPRTRFRDGLFARSVVGGPWASGRTSSCGSRRPGIPPFRRAPCSWRGPPGRRCRTGRTRWGRRVLCNPLPARPAAGTRTPCRRKSGCPRRQGRFRPSPSGRAYRTRA
ncbi:MAG: hypothetical protein IKR86_03170 [Candidatus Methanomethylophilaceae archaeon]|nr:hypothetical protein [Candidatus Methanomethylophilaceae archaeon]